MKTDSYRFWVIIFVLLASGCTLSRSPSAFYQKPVPQSTPPVSYKADLEEKNTEPPVSLVEENTESPVSLVEENIVKDKKTEEINTEEINKEENGQGLLDTALDFAQTSQDFWSKGDLENAIETLDQAYTLVLKVNTENQPELIQQKEDLRFMISKRILEIYASRYTAVDGNHNAIPLIMNKHVEKEIKLFQGLERKFFLASYNRSGKYREMIVKSLKEAGLPEELSWLPLIESGFKVKALSRARALGLWQFIPSTGYKFGLKRDTWIDERLNPEKSTTAAIEYLEELHNIFGDWTTVLAGYNCGEGRVLRVIRDQKINYLDNFWDLYERLPRETARYVPRFLATLHILNDPEKYGFDLEKPEDPLLYDLVSIEKQVELKKVAKEIGVSAHELNLLNPELRLKVTPPNPYSLRVPKGKDQILLAKLDKIPAWSPPKSSYISHRVRKGETLSLIALKYRTSVSSIVRANGIRHKHLIRVGQKLKIPLKGSGSSLYASKPKLLPGGKYRIRKGDSLWLIAKKFNTNTKTLMRINNLKTTRLYVGQTLKIVN
jgi:membrane-bound lytic murein transglycosylase D